MSAEITPTVSVTDDDDRDDDHHHADETRRRQNPSLRHLSSHLPIIRTKSHNKSIENASQAVVISVDPRRVWVSAPDDTHHATTRSESKRGPNGEEYCWWQCTIKGGREGRDVDVVQLATISEALGAGEILLNCIDNDGVGQGFDIELVQLVSDAVSIPVIASSGAGVPEHFSEVFEKTKASAGLAAGIFHRREVGINQVKEHLRDAGVRVRI
jgi:glutamine amidotransferase/cyclase